MSQASAVGPTGVGPAATPAPPAAPRVTVVGTQQRRRALSVVLRPLLMLGGIALAIAGGGYYWLQGGRYVSIDNAYVRAAKLAVSTDVSGTVIEVAVREGQIVKKGDLLFRLKPDTFQIAVEGAKANLAQVALSMEAMKRDYQRMLRDIEVRQAQLQSDQASFARFASLVNGGSVTRAEYDDARFKVAANKAMVEGLTTLAQVQLAKLGGDPNVDVTTTPQYLEAKARVDEAERTLSDTIVNAPFDGIATQVDTLQPGQYLPAGTAAFGLVSTENVWVEANPKETDLTYVKPGDPAELEIDTYPGRTWHGRVGTIAPASGAEFSVLPPQNASGNWVKVVQRIPLRVLVERDPGDPPLRAGMSVVVDIDTGHERHMSDLWP
jgi:membrane fusion protein (multidrug efflux system)